MNSTENTTLTPHELTRTEAIVELCKLAFAADDRQRLAVLKAVKALGKEIKHRADYARNLAARKADKGAFYTPDAVLADPPFVTPAPAPLSPDVPPMTEPSAPAPDAAETPNKEQHP
jgi:hypothetical protein